MEEVYLKQSRKKKLKTSPEITKTTSAKPIKETSLSLDEPSSGHTFSLSLSWHFPGLWSSPSKSCRYHFAFSCPLLLSSKRHEVSSRTLPPAPPPVATPGRWWSSWVCAVCRSVWGYCPWTVAPARSGWLVPHLCYLQRSRSGRSPARSGTSQTAQSFQREQRWFAGCAPWHSWCCPQSSVQEGSPACGDTGSEADVFEDCQSLDRCLCGKPTSFIFILVSCFRQYWLSTTLGFLEKPLIYFEFVVTTD